MHDEVLEAIGILLNLHHGSFEGRYFRFGEVTVKPAPVQQPFPLYLSGNVPEALERVATQARGWIVSATTPDEQLKGRIGLLRAAAARAGREPRQIEVCLLQSLAIDATEDGAWALHDALRDHRLPRERQSAAGDDATAPRRRAMGTLIGDPRQVAARLAEYRDMGVDHVGMVIEGRTVSEVIDRASLFAREVMPALT
jgi:alkanesulfonate monooxygenase SsuD/methylene tetrahydromethanopterin reductase-like flavin-dependent oxidoreductase (luciferase family)